MQLFFLVLIMLISFISFDKNNNIEKNIDLNLLVGTWKLDMSPEDKTDSNFANMEIDEVTENSFEGYFYRQGVKIRQGRINTQTGVIYGALVSGDNSGEYNSTFYYKDGILFGTTHALNRGFLSVWTATKSN